MPEPFLKWAGGKRWLVNRFVEYLPQRFNTYIEPFLGSGAVFFYLLPNSAKLSDANAELIATYRAVKEAPREVHNQLRVLHRQHSRELYYAIRSTNPADPITRAVRFIYLNRTCWNGLYRVNRQGTFNVPIGAKTLVEFPDGHLEEISLALQTADLKVADFETSVNQAEAGDFIYADPPYTVMHNNNNFIKYNTNLFSWGDQVRLSAALRRAGERGALIMLSNADNSSVRSLYDNFGVHRRLERSSVLAAGSSYRRKTTELLITNYKGTRVRR